MKPKPSWKSCAEFRRDDDDQRETVGPVGHTGADDADRLEAQELREGKFERARILAALGIDVEEAAATHRPCIDREADPRRRLERDVDLERTCIAAALREGEPGFRPHARYGGLQRPERRRDVRGEFDGNGAILEASDQIDIVDRDGTQRDVRRHRDLEGCAAGETQARILRVIRA